MEHFQPTALTISRDGAWEERRRFNEAVLDTGKPAHRLARRFATVIAQEGAALIDEIETDGDGFLDWDAFNLCVRRITLRAVLGDDARDDGRVFELLSKLMEEANGLPKERSEHYEPFRRRIEGYVADPEPESLVGLFADAPAGPDTDPAGQVPHWLFACGDTLAINAYRALALITTHPEQRAASSPRSTRPSHRGRRRRKLADRRRDRGPRPPRGLRPGRDAPLPDDAAAVARDRPRRRLERRRDPRRDPDPDLEHVQPPRPRARRVRRPLRARGVARGRRRARLDLQPLQPRAPGLPGDRDRALRRQGPARRPSPSAASTSTAPTSTRTSRCRRCSTSSRCASRPSRCRSLCLRLAA